ncbi:methylated-DNA--[protein]-cysteine S-methyltransferase [Gordonia shandongensis]|uniref:methylated-DNA--[protein]-cysteine S-methyltransferase n=1 Tax=Gordonia shandongensis TaxID=376351 RepID=UPI001FE0DC1A|nr:methylated-DNA--[protein]-cysteine S-methyltransferase [Gordonia shandongensis]
MDRRHRRSPGAHPRPERSARLAQRRGGTVAEAVEAYYDGAHDAPAAVDVRQSSGPFVEAAWAALRTVPPGAPVTYGQLAALAGDPAAARGAAQCCVRNVAALFVPCHRVHRADGSLGGFRYGLDLKQRLRDREDAVLSEALVSVVSQLQ